MVIDSMTKPQNKIVYILNINFKTKEDGGMLKFVYDSYVF